MADEKKKNHDYCGSGWQNKTFPGIVDIAIDLEKIKTLPLDQYGQVHIVVSARKAMNEKSKATHNVYVSDYWKEKLKK